MSIEQHRRTGRENRLPQNQSLQQRFPAHLGALAKPNSRPSCWPPRRWKSSTQPTSAAASSTAASPSPTSAINPPARASASPAPRSLLGLQLQELDEGKSQIAHGETVRETANMISFLAEAIGIRDDIFLGEGHKYMTEVVRPPSKRASRKASSRSGPPSSTCSAISIIPRNRWPT